MKYSLSSFAVPDAELGRWLSFTLSSIKDLSLRKLNSAVGGVGNIWFKYSEIYTFHLDNWIFLLSATSIKKKSTKLLANLTIRQFIVLNPLCCDANGDRKCLY